MNETLTAEMLLRSFLKFKRTNWKQKSAMPNGHKPSEIMVLFCVRDSGKPDFTHLKISDISRRLQIAMPTVTQLVNSLEAKGSVERIFVSDDRRQVFIKLTQQGEATTEKALKDFLKTFDGLIDFLGEEDSQLLAALMEKVFIYFNGQNKPGIDCHNRNGDE